MSDPVQIELIRQIGTLFTALPGALAAWFGYRSIQKAREIHDQGERNYHQMNSRMDQLLALKGIASEAIGEARERDRPKTT